MSAQFLSPKVRVTRQSVHRNHDEVTDTPTQRTARRRISATSASLTSGSKQVKSVSTESMTSSSIKRRSKNVREHNISDHELEPRVKKAKDQKDNSLNKFNFIEYRSQTAILRTLLRNTVKHVESNSILICGRRGSGKTTLVTHCLQLECNSQNSKIMYFSGFVDSNPLKMFHGLVQDVESSEKSISVILHEFLEECVDSGKCVILVIDEFDLFCRKNQTFLYNVFDLTQKCTQLFVIGVTTRLDCLELLEKRVKSRMNQAILHLNSPFECFDDFLHFGMTNYADSLQDETTFKTVLRRQYERGHTIRDLEKALIEFAWKAKSKSRIDRHDSSVSQTLMFLSLHELHLVVLAFRFCRRLRVSSVPCGVLIHEASRVPGRNRISRSLALKLVDNLIQYGILCRVSQQRNGLFLDEWTSLALNVGDDELRTTLDSVKASLPTSFQVLLSLYGH